MNRPEKSASQQTGIALLELLVAMILFAVVMTSVSTMHVRSIREEFDSRQRAHALWIGRGLIDKMHANNTSAAIQAYSDNIDSYSSCKVSPKKKCEPSFSEPIAETCDVTELVQADIWNQFCDGDNSALQNLMEHNANLTCLGGCAAGADLNLMISWISRSNDNEIYLRGKTIDVQGIKMPANRDFISLNFRP